MIWCLRKLKQNVERKLVLVVNIFHVFLWVRCIYASWLSEGRSEAVGWKPESFSQVRNVDSNGHRHTFEPSIFIRTMG